MIRKSGYRFSEEIMLKQKGETAHAVWRCGNVMIVPLTGTQFRLHKSGRPALEKSTGAGGGFDLEDIFTRRPLTLSAAFSFSRHCEPPGRANARPMTGSAKQSMRRQRKCGLLRREAPRNDGIAGTTFKRQSYISGLPPVTATVVRDRAADAAVAAGYDRFHALQSAGAFVAFFAMVRARVHLAGRAGHRLFLAGVGRLRIFGVHGRSSRRS